MRTGRGKRSTRGISTPVPLSSQPYLGSNPSSRYQKTATNTLNYDSASNLFLRGYYLLEGHAVAQLVEALCYKAESRGFDCQ
jgi:hypothetical protein